MHIEIPAEEEKNDKKLPLADLKSEIVKSSRTFDFSSRKATEFPSSCFKLLYQSTVHTINLSKNLIKILPAEFEQLDEHLTNLNYSLNQLTSLPNVIFKLKNLLVLDLRGNQLSQIDAGISRLDSLRELIIADNR
jgi:Leucine-rich repeat (LRR) protein